MSKNSKKFVKGKVIKNKLAVIVSVVFLALILISVAMVKMKGGGEEIRVKKLVNRPEDFIQITEMLRESVTSKEMGDVYKFPKNGEYSGCQINFEKESDDYIVFTSSCEGGGGNRYLAKRIDGKWVVITGMGQERPYCDDMEIYGISDEWYEGCIMAGPNGEGELKPGKLSL